MGIVGALFVLTAVVSHWFGRNTERLATRRCETDKAYASGYSAGVLEGRKLQHHYRFERNGASLWRYDESTGEACQAESNVTDNWIGGRCGPAIGN
jgi:hypothetical protein